MEAGWVEYKNCAECGGKLVKKKNRTGAMSTVKHEKENKNCSFKFGSVHDGGKKGTERAEEKNGKAAAAAAGVTAGGNTSTGGHSSGQPKPRKGKSGTAVAAGNDEGKNNDPAQHQQPANSDTGKSESYSAYLKRQYS